MEDYLKLTGEKLEISSDLFLPASAVDGAEINLKEDGVAVPATGRRNSKMQEPIRDDGEYRPPASEVAVMVPLEKLHTCSRDEQVVRFFRQRMDNWGRDEAHMKESTLNRADLLTLSPVLRHSLGAHENQLSFRQLIDSGKSLIINLAIPDVDARRLFGCLLTVGMESAALSRADNLTERTPASPDH